MKLRRHLLLTTALVVPGLIGYGGRKAYAVAGCAYTGGNTYLCSGAITTGQNIYGYGGVSVVMDAGATVDSSGNAGENAITITGDGDLSFTNTAGGAVSGAEAGLEIETDYGVPGSITVNTDQAISGKYGVVANNLGQSGALTLNVHDVTGTFRNGIKTNSYGTGTTITSTGTILGASNGIFALHNNGSAGALTINANNVTGTHSAAIFAKGYGTDLSVTVTGTATGSGRSIFTKNGGSGALSIDAVDVTAIYTSYAVIGAENQGTNLSIAVSGTVSGGKHGIEANNLGTGALTINADEISGASEDGITAINRGTDLSITSTGTVGGGINGIHARNYGSGALSVNAVDVSGTGGHGIIARTYSGTDLSVTATGDVTGNNNGIYARNRGTGVLSVNANNVSATTGYGIVAGNSGTDLVIASSGTITSGKHGIHANNVGTGALTINANNITSANNDGILAFNTAAGTGVSITTTGAVTGAVNGIQGENKGGGALSVSAHDVTGTASNGIWGFNHNPGTDLSISSTGTVIGGVHGINVNNQGTGALTVNANNVNGNSHYGINAENSGTNLTISSTGDVVGGKTGIRSRNYGSGALTINANNVTGTSSFGILAQSFSGTGIAITTTGVVTGNTGIYSRNNAAGGVTVNAHDVTGTGADGISLRNYGTNMSITSTGTISAARRGIDARKRGAGALSINANNITGTSSEGIYAINYNGPDLSITTTGTVVGGTRGMNVGNNGTGALTINANNVTGQNGDAIVARNEGTNLSITTTGEVTGTGRGIFGVNNGSGALTINANNVAGAGSDGIKAEGHGTDISITATGTVMGAQRGIYARSFGSGAIGINANNVTGTANDGIYSYMVNGGSDLSIATTGLVNGGRNGIRAFSNYSTGAWTIDAVDVIGASQDGISIRNSPFGTSLSIASTGTVSGAQRGIEAQHYGSGALSINANNVTGTSNDGIYGFNNSGTDLSITATGDVIGGNHGISGRNSGSGTLAINANNVTGTNGFGIYAKNQGTDLSVASTGSVVGDYRGILAANNGSGALTINANNVSGGNGIGIQAQNGHEKLNAGTDITINVTGTVMGDDLGIFAVNYGSGSNEINIAAAANVSGGNQAILSTGSINDTVNNDGTITGDVALNGGSDVFNNNAGGTLNGDLAAGSGGDTVNNSGTITGDVDLGSGGNFFTNLFGGIFSGNLSSGNGDDTVANAGEMKDGNTDLGDGNNSFINTGTVTGNVTAGSGDDTYQNEGTHTGDVALGGGNNTIGNTSVETLNGNVTTGAGDDNYDNSGVHNGNVTLGDGTNTATNSGTLVGNLTTGSGVDTVNNSGTITGDVDLGDGGNFFTNLFGGIFGGDVTTGSGNDTVANAGGMVGNANLGDGDNSFDNTGGFQGDLFAGAGNDTATNSGVFDGNVNLGGGTNSFTNLAGGVFAPGDTINLGAGGTMVNAGDLLPGGNGVIQTTTITGNFTQTATGTIGLDVDDQAKVKTDRLLVSGTARLAGRIVPNIINLSEDQRQFTIIVANGGAIDAGLSVGDVVVVDTVGFDFEIVFDGNDVILTSNTPNTIKELLEGSTAGRSGSVAKDASSVARVLDASVEQSPALQQLVTALRALPDMGSVASAVERLTPKSQAEAASGAVTGVGRAGNAMLSCQVREGDQRYTREGQCYWAKVTVRRLDRDATKDHSGVEEDGVEVMGGLQWALWDELRMGVALGYADTNSDSMSQTQKLGSSDGQRFTAGLVLKNQWGPVNAYLNLVGSYGSYDLNRIAGLGFGNALAEQDVTSLMTRLRLSYLMDGNGLYMRPMIDLNATYVDLDGYQERGAGAANLTVSGVDEWFLSVTPAIEFGGETRLENDTLIRPYLRGGVTFIDQDSMSVDVNFAAAPAGVQPFSVNSELQDVYGVVEAGLHILTPEGLNFKLSYDGRFSDDSREHAGTLKIGKNF